MSRPKANESEHRPRIDLARFREDLVAVHATLSRHNPPQQQLDSGLLHAWASQLPSLDETLHRATSRAYEAAEVALKLHLEHHQASPLVGSTSLFRAIGFRRDEVAHTQAIAWLLDPLALHGFGTEPLRALLAAVERSVGAQVPVVAEIRRQLAEPVSVYAEWPLSAQCRIDLLIRAGPPNRPTWQILVEAKIDAGERDSQLGDYLSLCREHQDPALPTLAIFLTPEGHRPRTSTGCDDWIPFSFLQWASSMSAMLAKQLEKPGAPFLRTYLTGVLEDVTGLSCKGDTQQILRSNNPIRLVQLLGTHDHDRL